MGFNIKIVKVTSNDSTEMIYLPKEIREVLNLRKGTYVKMKIEGRKLIVEPLLLEDEDLVQKEGKAVNPTVSGNDEAV